MAKLLAGPALACAPSSCSWPHSSCCASAAQFSHCLAPVFAENRVSEELDNRLALGLWSLAKNLVRCSQVSGAFECVRASVRPCARAPVPVRVCARARRVCTRAPARGLCASVRAACALWRWISIGTPPPRWFMLTPAGARYRCRARSSRIHLGARS